MKISKNNFAAQSHRNFAENDDYSVEFIEKNLWHFGPKLCRNLFSSAEKDDNSVEKKSAENK